VVRGIAQELLVATGIAKPDTTNINQVPPERVSKRWMTVLIPNTEEFKLICDAKIAAEPNLKVLYHSMAYEVEVKEGRVAAVIIGNKDGLTRIEARQVVDCTGDGDIAQWAGCPMEMDTQRPLMPMTLHFRIGNVKPSKETQPAAKQAMIQAHERGELPECYGPGLIYAFAKDEVYVHATRVPGNAVDARDLTRAEMQGRRDAWTMFREWKKHAPGFEDSYFISSGPYIGVRETRRIVGQYVLSEDDLRKGTSHDDAIATGSWFLDFHSPKTSLDKAWAGSGFQPEPYDISYRTLLPQKVSNLLVAGRCHSSTQMANTSSRVTATAMALGEAAGCAAALALGQKTEVGLLAGVKVREKLAAGNAGPFTKA
jgi:FAD dependent oxidoreductase